MEIHVKKWDELTSYRTPEWMKKAKFGIYTHWGVYSVPGFGPNVSWYPYKMYQEGTDQYAYHCKHYGHPSKVGYKDLIPMFTGEKFNADEWAELFFKAGAKFAGPVAEHHDGFSMWNSKVNRWNAANMGPKHDVAGELERAVRKRGMYYMAAFHHAENWKFFPHWVREYDTSDPQYADLYGEAHNVDWGSEKRYMPEGIRFNPEAAGSVDMQWFLQDLPGETFHERWFLKMKEVIDAYHPDYIWFDFGLSYINDLYQRKFLTYYQDEAARNGQQVAISYKGNDLPVGSGMVDLEQGRFDRATYHDWITDTTVDAGEAWGYMRDAKYKTSKSLIHYLADNVSKNGYLLLNVGPKPDGTIPEEAEKILLEMGEWLGVNGEAIYGTTTWRVSEEGPTRMVSSGAFCEMNEVAYTGQDIRYTMKDNNIYAIALGRMDDHVSLRGIFPMVYEGEIEKVSFLGDGKPLKFRKEGNRLIVETEGRGRNETANVLKIERREIF